MLIDHHVGLFTGLRDIDVNELKLDVVGWARAAQIRTLPVVPVTVACDSKLGTTIPELTEVRSDTEILDRSTVNARDDERFVAKVVDYAAMDMPFATLMDQVTSAMTR